MNLRNLIIGLCLIAFFLIYNNQDVVFIEDINFIAGFGIDMPSKDKTKRLYNSSMNYYVFNEAKDTSNTIYGYSEYLSEARSNRQRRTGKKFLAGSEKITLIDDNTAKDGIEEILDIFMANPFMTNNSYLITTTDKAQELLELKINEYPSSCDYMYGMVENLSKYNFFPKNDYIYTTYFTSKEEGIKAQTPHIENKEGSLQITGVSIFDKDKKILHFPIKDAELMNMLKFRKTEGFFNYDEGEQKFLSLQLKSKNKVKCNKLNDSKYDFDINLNLEGVITNNQLFHPGNFDKNSLKIAEKKVEDCIKKKANNFIFNMQNGHGLDLLNLGHIAAVKYGRNTGVDWDEVISNSTITVNVNVKINNVGLGNY